MLILTPQERASLAKLESKLTLLRDKVRGVAKCYNTGLIVWGEGGTSKSFTTLSELKECQAKFMLHNSRMTGRGLVDVLERNPHDIHVIEDAETLFDDKKSWGVLRSALYSRDTGKPMKREISWTAFNTTIRFTFYGGIIISNANISATVPALRALKTRIQTLRLDIDNEEMISKMKQICIGGHRFGDEFLTPEECWEVAEFIIGRLETLNRPLDLRLLVNGGFKDRLQCKSGTADRNWDELLQTRIDEAITVVKTHREKKLDESQIAAEIESMKLSREQKNILWREKTGGSERSRYRALQRLQGR
jgi:hypothetical protein